MSSHLNIIIISCRNHW